MNREQRMFNPVNGKEVTDNIALQIEAAILNNEFKPGEKLPSERDLQNLFQTGRGVIREAPPGAEAERPDRDPARRQGRHLTSR